MKDDTTLHVLITGSRQAGISSFIAQKRGDHEANDEMGIGIDIQSARVFHDGTEYTVFFYEVSGTFPLDALRKILKKKRVGFAAVFDLSNPVSLEMAELLYSQIHAKLGDTMPRAKFLLGSHLDLETGMDDQAKAKLSESIEALVTIMGNGTHYAEFSTETGENLESTMELLVRKILEQSK